jgi:regulatory protein
LLARREHSRHELHRKLLLKKFPSHLINQILSEIEQHGWQSDKRFSEAYAHMRCNRGYGPMRIQAELRERGIADALIHTVLDELEPQWQTQIEIVFAKKFFKKINKDAANLAKQMRFLQYRGFTNEQIRALLKGITAS